jgi:hypothetical protein
MQQQTATVNRKKKPNLWGLAGILFCLNIAVYYFMFIWPASAAVTGHAKQQNPEALSHANVSGVNKKN